MDIISAYRQGGTYRGAAAICGTTHKTVRRVIERAEAGGVAPARRERVRNFDTSAASHPRCGWPSGFTAMKVRVTGVVIDEGKLLLLDQDTDTGRSFSCPAARSTPARPSTRPSCARC